MKGISMQKILSYFFAHVKNGSPQLINILCYAIVIWLLVAIIHYVNKRNCVIKVKKTILLGMLSVNLSFVFVMTLLGRNVGDEFMVELVPFASYFNVITERDVELLLQIIMNILMYVPFGFLLPHCFQSLKKYRHVFCVTFFCSGIIECIQGLLKIGMFEMDDILNNVLGMTIGFCFYVFVLKKEEKND